MDGYILLGIHKKICINIASGWYYHGYTGMLAQSLPLLQGFHWLTSQHLIELSNSSPYACDLSVFCL